MSNEVIAYLPESNGPRLIVRSGQGVFAFVNPPYSENSVFSISALDAAAAITKFSFIPLREEIEFTELSELQSLVAQLDSLKR